MSVWRPSAAGAAFYTVRQGDTIWEVAVSHYTGDPRKAVWETKRANDIEDSFIEPAQVLVLPV